MPELSADQFSLVYNMFSLTIAAMFGTFVFFVLAKEQIATKYRTAIVCSGLVVLIAGYHYFRIFQSWDASYALDASGNYVATGVPFNDAYRYVDWLLTVPLLLVELVLVLALTREKTIDLLQRLIIAAVLMIGLGYPGEVSNDGSTQMIFFVLSFIPFVYILRVLYKELGKEIEHENGRVKELVEITRNVLVVTWAFYPLAYLFNLGAGTADAEIGVQVGYTIADIAAKCAYGILVWMIARQKTMDEEGAAAPAPRAAAAKA
jgi:bacteriorhodopsin